MKHARALARVAVLAVALAALPVPGSSSAAITSDVVVVDLPVSTRVEPRAVELLGETATQGVLLRREADRADTSWGDLSPVLVATDGSASSEGSTVRDVVGDRVVEGPYYWFSTRLRSRVLPDGDWTDVVLADGYTLVDYTRDGVLVSSYFAPTLRLLPWSGGDAVAVGGVPEGFGPADYGSALNDVHDARGAVVRTYARDRSGAVHQLYVDTAAAQAWVLPESGVCDARVGTAWGIGADALVWRSGRAAVLCTLGRPLAGQVEVGTPQSRPAPTLPVSDQATEITLTPVGDQVVASVRLAEAYAMPGQDLPVVVVDADGSTSELVAWGHHVVPSGDQAVLVVGGEQPQSTVRRIDPATGALEIVLPDDPRLATTSGLALADGRLVTREDHLVSWGSPTPLREYTFDPVTGAVEGSVTVTASATSDPVVSESGTAWAVGGDWVHRDSGGSISSHILRDAGLPPGGPTDLAEPFIAFGSGAVLDTATGRVVLRETWEKYPRLLVDGVVYTVGADPVGGPQDSVLARDPATGQASAIPVPGCQKAVAVQVAGSWLLVTCDVPDGVPTFHLLDRSAGTVQELASAGTSQVVLGNGYLAQRQNDGSVDWAPLEAPNDWRPLAPPGAAQWLEPAVGQSAALAYSDGHTNHVALLPVSPRRMPQFTHDAATPHSPVMSLSVTDDQLTVSWQAPPVEDRITGYALQFNGSTPLLLAATARSQTVGIQPGRRYDVRLVAANIAGNTASTASYGRLDPPPTPTNVTATVDPVTLRTHVTWDWTAVPGAETPTYFELVVNNRLMTTVDNDRRSADFTFEDKWTGRVAVIADGFEDSVGLSNVVDFPGPDVTPPVVRLAPLPKVSFGEIRPRWSGTDDRGWLAYEVRHRSGTSTDGLGPWQHWKTSDTSIDDPNQGLTHCFAVRAHDSYGNYSDWTPARCTTVPIDERRLTRRGTWKRLFDERMWQSTAATATSGTPALKAGKHRTKAVWLVATTCPTCGSIRISDGSGYSILVSLRLKRTQPRAVLRVPWPTPTTGAITLRRDTKPGLVSVDALALRTY